MIYIIKVFRKFISFIQQKKVLEIAISLDNFVLTNFLRYRLPTQNFLHDNFDDVRSYRFLKILDSQCEVVSLC